MPDSQAPATTEASLPSPRSRWLWLALASSMAVLPALAGAPGLGVLAALALVVFIQWRRGRFWPSLGFVRPDSWLRTVGLSVLIGALIQLLSVALVRSAARAAHRHADRFRDPDGNLLEIHAEI